MATPITNYTTYDLAYYYADLRQTRRLSNEERRQLAAIRSETAGEEQARKAQHTLIESYLHLAKALAIDLCPTSCYQRLLPDLIGEANLALVETVNRYDPTRVRELTPYLAAFISGSVKQALLHDTLIKIPSNARARATAQGIMEQLSPLLHVLSLDKEMEWFDTDELEEPAASSLTPTQAAPERDPVVRAQVQEYLSYLSAREQAVVRLRYGLSDEDERSYSVGEIASLLDLPRKTIDSTLSSAYLRIRALAGGTATVVEKEGEKRVTGIYKGKRRLVQLQPEQEDRLFQAARSLQAQGRPVSIRTLARESGLSAYCAAAFLRKHESLRGKGLKLDEQARFARLEVAYTHLQEQGITVTYRRLAQETHSSQTTIAAFMREKHGKETQAAHIQARDEQLETTYRALVDQGLRPTYERLAQAAHTSYSTVRAFLKAKQDRASRVTTL